MKFTRSPVWPGAEILASDQFQTVPVTITGSAAVKAGMPVKRDGSVSPTGAGADGILLYDVNPDVNPNGAMVVQGIVNWTKCMENGASADASTMKNLLPSIVFRDDIGVN